jgi:hypothetical protein
VGAIGVFLGSVYRRELSGRVELGRLDHAEHAGWRARRKRAVTVWASHVCAKQSQRMVLAAEWQQACGRRNGCGETSANPPGPHRAGAGGARPDGGGPVECWYCASAFGHRGHRRKHVRNLMAKLDLPETGNNHRRVLAVITFLEAH